MEVTDWQTKSQFEEITNKPGTHLIVFAARWCGFCSRFLQQAKSLPAAPDVKLDLVDTDNPDESLWDEYDVNIVPTLLVIKDSKVIFRRDGKSFAGLSVADLQEGISRAKVSG